MNAIKTIEIMQKYNKCPDCGSNIIGNGQGKLIVDDNTLTRECKCGFKITVDENNNEIKPVGTLTLGF